MKITDQDILYVEKLLLKPNDSFNDERRRIIKSLETIDVIANPGSGKTTTLLAKLAILNKKLPLKNNSGLCILTHTNTAINEIKNKLGLSGINLFKFPNSCSTIQIFVNQFLAIPAYTHFYGRRPIRIDDDIYDEVISKKYYKEIPQNLQYGIKKGYIDVRKIRYNLNDGTLVNGLYGKYIYKNHKSPSYISLKELKESMMEEGILCYDDAYYLAFKYLRKFPNLKEIFSKRFRYVFIDEMQDTMKHQTDILNSIFDDSVIIQRIGDPNQAIYDNSNANGTWEIKNDSVLQITDSKRFSTKIASLAQNICVTPQNLVGNQLIRDITPKILVYTNDTQSNVISHFSDLIFENNLHMLSNGTFKAVGWVSENEKLGITDYWNSYKKGIKKKKDFKHLNSYLLKDNKEEVINSNFYRKNILRGLLKALRIMNEKNKDEHFTIYTFLKYLQETHEEVYNQLLLKLAIWCLEIQNGENVLNEVISFITNEFKIVFDWEATNKLNNFFQEIPEDVLEEHKINTNQRTYFKKEEYINIDVSSVHGVKGETHTATLYLETYYHDYDIKRIIDYLKGKHTSTTAKRKLQNLKMTYVGITRPSHLLCIAIRKETIEGHEEELETAGWDIQYVKK